MTTIDPADSVIQDILDDTMLRAGGLDYAAYAVVNYPDSDRGGRDGEPKLEILNASRNDQLGQRLANLASRKRTADQQVGLWETVLQKVNAAMRSLDAEFVRTGQGENVRVIFDIDMGGFYYTRIGRYAVLFGATLDQAEVNNGRCEREMLRMVAQIEAVCSVHGG